MENIQEFFSDILPQLGSIIGQFFSQVAGIIGYAFSWLGSHPVSPAAVYSQVIRWVMPLLAIHILLSVLRKMLKVKNPHEVWAYLVSPDFGRFPVNHWECTVGRARHCDIILKLATISRTQCAIIRNDRGQWFLHGLSDHVSTLHNGKIITGETEIHHGDIINIGGLDLTFESMTRQELEIQKQKRIRGSSPLPPWSSFLTITAFQILTATQLCIARPDSVREILTGYAVLAAVMWFYVLFTRAAGQKGFEPEILAFFACSLNLAVTATSNPEIMLKQALSIVLGVAGFMILGWYLRDLKRTVKTRYFMAGLTVFLFIVNIVCGRLQYGARNWISIFGVSVQPSEIAKICFIFAGAATLDRLFVRKNLFGFMCLSGFCLLALAVTGDFGSAAIFFVVFLVIAFMRSGDFATLSLICGGAAGAILLILRFKPYIASRFSVWGHVWDDPTGMGYQQVRTMSASASGGLIGVGAGNGWLHNVAASNTDLVFGILCEEWGLIIALLSIAIILVLSVFAYRVVQAGRSSYYTIAACAATSLMVFQTMLNVFGSVDILPLTGVTFPFISCGGTSMIASWGLLAFLKAADTRQNASFAVRRKSKLSSDIPDDPLSALQNKNAAVNRTAAPSVTLSTIQLQPGPGIQERQQAEDDEIDAFLRQFDEVPYQDDSEDEEDDEILSFLKEFDKIPEDDNERRPL